MIGWLNYGIKLSKNRKKMAYAGKKTEGGLTFVLKAD